MSLSERSYAGVRRWLLELREQIGIPHTLAGLGVRSEHATNSRRRRSTIHRRPATRGG